MVNEKIHRNLLDELDMKLAAELQADARQTTRDLAKKLGVSAQTVSNRIRRMSEDGFITFCARSNPLSLGFQVEMICGLNVAPGKSADIERALESCKSVQMISLTMGRYGMVIYAAFRDNQELLDWMTDQLSRIPDVITTEEMTILKIVKTSYGFLSSGGASGRDVKVRYFDESELKLVAALESNPRESIGVLGKKIGMDRRTAARKLKGLLDEGLIKVMSVTEALAFGLTIRAYVFLRVRPDRIIPIAHTLAAQKEITHVAIVTGCFNIMVYMAFRDLDEMARFLTDEIGNVPGVIGYETMIHVGGSSYYRSFRLMGR